MPPAEAGIPPSALIVSFDGNATDGVSGQIKVSEYHQMPGFGHDFGDLHDLGILLLPADSVATGIPAVQLPTAGYLDQLKAAGDLKFRIADIVGYGVTPVWEPAGPTTFVFDPVRRSGTSIITGLTKSDAPLQPEPERDRHRLRSLLRRLRLAAVRPRHTARALRHERRQRPVQREQRELPGGYTARPGVLGALLGAPVGRFGAIGGRRLGHDPAAYLR